MTLFDALEKLVKARHLTPLTPTLPPNQLPPFYNSSQYCAYHQSHGHPIDKCFHLHHDIQDFFDEKKIAPPSVSKHNIIANPLPNHNLSRSYRTNFTQTDSDNFDPSALISPTVSPKTQSYPLSTFTSEDVPEWILRGMEKEEKEEETLFQVEKEFGELMCGQPEVEFKWFDMEKSANTNGWGLDFPEDVLPVQPEVDPRPVFEKEEMSGDNKRSQERKWKG